MYYAGGTPRNATAATNPARQREAARIQDWQQVRQTRPVAGQDSSRQQPRSAGLADRAAEAQATAGVRIAAAAAAQATGRLGVLQQLRPAGEQGLVAGVRPGTRHGRVGWQSESESQAARTRGQRDPKERSEASQRDPAIGADGCAICRVCDMAPLCKAQPVKPAPEPVVVERAEFPVRTAATLHSPALELGHSAESCL